MSDVALKPLHLEQLLARLLKAGTWIASGVIAIGLVVPFLDHGAGFLPAGTQIIRAGIALFILLPILRVGVMAIVFLHERDYRFAMIAGAVLSIILIGFAIGALSS
jgi:uncharacterized membrane protein